jgi:hypothetical protein
MEGEVMSMSPNKTQEQVRCQRCGAEIPDAEVARRAAQLSGRLGGAAGKGSPARRRAAVYASHCRWGKVKAARAAALVVLVILGAAAWAPAQSHMVLVRDLTVMTGQPPPPPPELEKTPKYAWVAEEGSTSLGNTLLPMFRQILLDNGFELLKDLKHAAGFPHPYLRVRLMICHIRNKAVAINVSYAFMYGQNQRGMDGFQMMFTGDDDQTLPELESSALANLKNDLFAMK